MGLSTRKKQEPAHPLHIDPDRNEQRVRYRYLQYTKAELVERLLCVEQAYVQSQQQLAQLQFAWLETKPGNEKESTIKK